MIADTTFLSDFLRERLPRPMTAELKEARAAAHRFLAAHRRTPLRASIISVGEVAVMFDRSWQAWWELQRWTIYRLHPGIAEAAADVDRELMSTGQRLGENDNWIAGFCLYYREPLISRDGDFDRVPGLRRLSY